MSASSWTVTMHRLVCPADLRGHLPRGQGKPVSHFDAFVWAGGKSSAVRGESLTSRVAAGIHIVSVAAHGYSLVFSDGGFLVVYWDLSVSSVWFDIGFLPSSMLDLYRYCDVLSSFFLERRRKSFTYLIQPVVVDLPCCFLGALSEMPMRAVSQALAGPCVPGLPQPLPGPPMTIGQLASFPNNIFQDVASLVMAPSGRPTRPGFGTFPGPRSSWI
ncbi:uncharacterized protein B0T15DRAFT_515250 [Chaetomium strumarium]|uniref:Uncharacterized protein n=1 Tax=Chaetomium strumarium TaxID=1170767 RepID=A0AAJ0H035_9PEZI|nr:hypothetical protein B0T15DRAFT_515250 [Chaetomium strumarium]